MVSLVSGASGYSATSTSSFKVCDYGALRQCHVSLVLDIVAQLRLLFVCVQQQANGTQRTVSNWVGFVLSPHESQELNSSCQAWQ